MTIRLLPLFVLLLPLIEIAGFVIVGSRIGVLATIGLVLLSAVAGAFLLRVRGFDSLRRIQRELEAGRDTSRELVNGGMMMLAGVLLMIPGFVTDIMALLLLLPPVRDFAWRQLRPQIVVSGGFAPGGPARRDARTIDLDRDDYSRDPDETSPWRRIDKE